MPERDILPYYPVERRLFNAADTSRPRHCPVCGKSGAWVGDTFVPASDRQARHPPCHCAAIHAAGARAYDPATRTMIPREEHP